MRNEWRLNHYGDEDIIVIHDEESRNRIMVHGTGDESIDCDTLNGVFVSVTVPQGTPVHYDVALTVLPYIANTYTVLDVSCYVTSDNNLTTYLLIDPRRDTIREIAGDIYRMLID